MIELSGRTVHYSVRSSRRAKRMQIQADVGVGITVVVPARLRRVSPENFLRAHEPWVLQQIERIDSIRSKAPQVDFRHGGTIPLLGRACPVRHRYHDGRRTKARYGRGEIVVDRAAEASDEIARKAILDLVRSIAREILAARVEHWCREIGVARRRMTVRSQKTRWGSCTSDGSISLNWRLVLTPPEALDYVVAHEVAHIVHAHHGPEFQGLLDRFYPDWRTWDRWLDEVGVALTSL